MILTMVARSIAAQPTKGKTAPNEAYTYILLTEDYKVQRVDGIALKNALAKGSKEFTVTNMGIENGKLVSTNGAMSKYPVIDANTGMFVGEVKNTVLNRIEKEGKLIGYTIFLSNGQIHKVSLADAVKLAKQSAITNGKLRDTNAGPIVVSIQGEYPRETVQVDKAPKAVVTLRPMLITHNTKVGNTYATVVVNSESAVAASKIGEAIAKKSNELIEFMKQHKSTINFNSLKAQRFQGTGTFAVVDMETFKALVAKCELESSFKCMISILDEHDDKSFSETVINLTREKGKFKVDDRGEEKGKELDMALALAREAEAVMSKH